MNQKPDLLKAFSESAIGALAVMGILAAPAAVVCLSNPLGWTGAALVIGGMGLFSFCTLLYRAFDTHPKAIAPTNAP